MVIFNSYVKLPEGKAVVNTVCDGLIMNGWKYYVIPLMINTRCDDYPWLFIDHKIV